jgi:hypothetical protein
VPVEQMRMVTIFGEVPNWTQYAESVLLNASIAALCFVWFQRARRHFADVL